MWIIIVNPTLTLIPRISVYPIQILITWDHGKQQDLSISAWASRRQPKFFLAFSIRALVTLVAEVAVKSYQGYVQCTV